jgi:hypothetical protein
VKPFLLALAIALLAAAPAAAETEVFVAYGEGNTACTIQVSKLILDWGQDYSRVLLSGQTDCNVAIEQSARAWMDPSAVSPAAEGDLCSGFTKTCGSGTFSDGGLQWPEPVQYHVRLTAPRGQGWVGVPTHCSGVGTDNLDCVFQARVATPWLAF